MIHQDRRGLEVIVLRHLAHHPADIIDWVHPLLFLNTDTIAAAKWLQWAAVTDDLSGVEAPGLALRAVDLPAPPGDPFTAMLNLLDEAVEDLRDLLQWEVTNFESDPFARDNLEWVERLLDAHRHDDLDATRLLLVATRFAHQRPRACRPAG